MKKRTALVIGFVAVFVTIGFLLPRSPNIAYEDCDVELLAKEVSTEGDLVAEYRRGTCDDGTTVLHTLGIGPVRQKYNEKVPSVVLTKTSGIEAVADLQVEMKWLDSKTLEVTHPGYIQPKNPSVLNGVTVVGKEK